MMQDDLSQTTGLSCGVCGGHSLRAVILKRGDFEKDKDPRLSCCSSCQTVFLNNSEKEFVPHLYQYYGERSGQDKAHLYNPINDKRYQDLWEQFSSLKSINKTLDFGCGQGQFVNYLKKTGKNVLGIDLSASAVAICRRLDLPVQEMDIFDLSLKPETFDLITMFEVIEHVSAPPRFLVRAEELLTKGGLLYLTTPNFSSLERRVLGMAWRVINNEHLFYFTPRTLRHLIRRYTGLEILSMQTHNVSMETLRRLFSFAAHASAVRQGTKNLDYSMGEGLLSKEQLWRSKIESSECLGFLKKFANGFLNFLKWGATIKILCRKRSKK